MERNLVIKYETQEGMLCGVLMVKRTGDVLVRVVADMPYSDSYEYQKKAIKRKIAEYLAKQLLYIMEE